MEKRGANEAEKWRLFVAVELPPAAKEALVRLQEALRRQGLASWRWVRPEGVHLTLKFLGETPVERVPEVERAVSEAVAGTSAFEMALAEPGAFSDRRGPRVLWVGLSGDVSRLAEVQRRLEERLAATGFPREERPFSPHLTLARAASTPGVGDTKRVAEAVESVRPEPVRIPVEELSLMRSMLGPGGAQYSRLAAFPLG